VDLQAKPVARAVNEEFVQAISSQDLPRRSIHIRANRAARCRRDRGPLGLQNSLIPSPYSFWGPPHVDGAGNVAAIVAEYSTQVQHHQLIFPQSLGRGPGMREGGPLSKATIVSNAGPDAPRFFI